MDDFFEENAPEQIKKRYKTPAAKKSWIQKAPHLAKGSG